MAVEQLNITDIFFTPDNNTLLRSPLILTPISEVMNENNQTLQNLLRKDAQINGENQKFRAELLNDMQEIRELAEKEKEVDSTIPYKGNIYRVNRSQAENGAAFALRRIPTTTPPINQLGFPPNVVNLITQLGKENGLILIAGSTGAGKTTTISSMLLSYIRQYGNVAYTIEDPPEYPIQGIYQENGHHGYCLQTRPPNGDWAQGLANALRSNSRYIFLGEIRNAKSAAELLRAANSGHLVFSSIHAQSPQHALNALTNYAVSQLPEKLALNFLAQSILCVIHQTIFQAQLQAEFLFAGPAHSAVRNKISEAKFLSLANDIQQQAIRIQNQQPLFS